MKHFNFINSVPEKTQKDFNIWFKISAIFFIILLVLAATISLAKIIKITKSKREIIKLRQETNLFEQVNFNNQEINLNQNQAQTQTKNFNNNNNNTNNINIDIESKLKKLARWKNPKLIPAVIFQDLSELIPDDVLITEINYKSKQPIIIKGQTKSLISLKKFTQNLKNTDWAKSNKITKVQNSNEENKISDFELVIS